MDLLPPFAAKRTESPGGKAPARIEVAPLASTSTFRNQVHDALKQAIIRMNIYAQPGEVRLDERRLARELGVSRTPVRMAMALLEKEGIVRTIRYRGVFVIRRTRREIVEMITVWAALESMAARLAAMRATDDEVAALRAMFEAFDEDPGLVGIDAYSDANNAFHDGIIRLSRCALIGEVTDRLMIHIQPIRALTIAHDDRARHSMQDHRDIIAALERRDAAEAERLVRRHTLGLAAHVERHCTFLN